MSSVRHFLADFNSAEADWIALEKREATAILDYVYNRWCKEHGYENDDVVKGYKWRVI